MVTTKQKAFRHAVQSFEGVLRSQHRVYDGRGEVARTQDVWGAEDISGRVKFLLLAWAGMPKTSFRKNSDSPHQKNIFIFSPFMPLMVKTDNFSRISRGVPTFAKACFGHPSPSSWQKLNGTDYNLRCPDSPCVHS